MDDFELELKNGFLEEVSQLLADAEQSFLQLESNPDSGTIEKLFRIAHNIKGSSKAVGFDALGAFTHEFETFMLKFKSGQLPINPRSVSFLLKCNDHLNAWVNALKKDLNAQLSNDALIEEILNFSADASENPQHTQNTPNDQVEDHSPEAEQHPTEEATYDENQNVVQFSNNAATKKQETKQNQTTPSNGESSEESIRVSLARLEKLLNFVGEIVILQTVLKEQIHADNPNVLKKTVHLMGKVTKEVQDLSMSLRMVPLKQTFQKMQRIVRDTSAALGKKVQLVLEGEETEVDKTVLESLSDPLVHLIRNAVDHGIESPEERLAKGKSDSGRIVLKASHQGGKLQIKIVDDGGGINPARIRQKAIEKGILRPGQEISDRDAIQLIFHPGFSTKAQVTEVSGRGVGMDVVKTNIEHLSGEVLVDTEVDHGSNFKIILPLTLAIIDGMIIRAGEERFIIPLSHVHESVKPEKADIKQTTGLGEVLMLRGENLPIFRLSKVLGRSRKSQASQPSEKIAIIIRYGNKPFAAMVDDIIGQHQVVIKKLGAEIQSIRGYSGSAILGDGKPAIILELNDLLSSPTANSPQNRKAVA